MHTESKRIALVQTPATLVPPDQRARQVQIIFKGDPDEPDLLFMIDGKSKADGDRAYDFCEAGRTSPVMFPLGPGQHVIGAASDGHLIVTVLITYED